MKVHDISEKALQSLETDNEEGLAAFLYGNITAFT